MRGIIKDRFEIMGKGALEYGAAGVVIMVDHEAAIPPPKEGDLVLLAREDGWLYRGRAEDVRVESTTHITGLFLRGLHSEQVPIGSTLSWGSEIKILEAAVA